MSITTECRRFHRKHVVISA